MKRQRRVGQKSNLSKITQQLIDEEYIVKPGEFISKVIEISSNYLLKVETEHGEIVFISVPNKFRNFLYISIGMFIASEYVEEGIKVKGILVAILYEKQINCLVSQNLWPKHFENLYIKSKKDYSDMFPLSDIEDDSDLSNIED